MNTSRKKIFFASLAFVFSGVFWLCDPCLAEDPGNSEQLRIGAILPLSGQSASLGNYIRNGIALSYEKLPAERKKQVELFYEDDGWQIPRSVSAYRRLVSHHKVNAFLVVGSAVGNALAPLAEKDGIPLISIGASDFNVVKGRTFAFIHWVTPEVEARVMVEEIRKRGYKHLALISGEQEGILAVYRAVIKELKRVGLDGKIVLDQKFLTTETDFRTYVAKARKRQVDGVIVCLFPGALSSFAKQIRQGGVQADLMGIELFEDSNEVAASQGALIGQWYINSDSATSNFEKIYYSSFKEHPGWAAANAYDSLQLLAAAHQLYGNNGSKIAEYLSQLTDYRGAAGTYSSTGDNRFTLAAAVKVVRKDGFEKLVR